MGPNCYRSNRLQSSTSIGSRLST